MLINNFEYQNMRDNEESACDFVEYDIIFIGQLGAVVCNILVNSSPCAFKCLVVNNSKTVNEPSLLPVQNSTVTINHQSCQSCDWETGKLFMILPEDSLISIEDKKSFRYKYLVFGTDAEDWADYSMIENLKEALLSNYSFVYSNILKSDPKLSLPGVIFQWMENSRSLELKRLSLMSCQKSRMEE
jgi:hypothetical protein